MMMTVETSNALEMSDNVVEQSDGDSSNESNNIINCTTTTKAEIRQVKVLVLLAVFFSICGAIGVFFYTKLSETEQFKKQYDDDSNKVSFPIHHKEHYIPLY
jgi:hypothetical protein